MYKHTNLCLVVLIVMMVWQGGPIVLDISKHTNINVKERRKFSENEEDSKGSIQRGKDVNNLDIYGSRQEKIEEICKKHQPEIAANYKQFWPHENFQAVLGHADVFENKHAGFLWCRVPKAASVSWTSLFVERWFPKRKKDQLYKQQLLLRQAWTPKPRTTTHLKAASKTLLSFLTSRHPFDRLLSAYRDKFFISGLDHKFEKMKVKTWHDLYGKEIIANYRRTKPTDTKYSNAPTFREFVEYLVELPLHKFNGHWIPMYIQCMPCHIKYSILARLDTLARDSEQVLQNIGVKDRLPVSHVTSNTTDNTSASYYSQLDKNLLEKLYHIYKFDFLLFNYTQAEYQQFLKH